MECCCYCGIELTGSINNAEDYGLHKDTRNKSCCDRCNRVITIPNRCLANYIRSGNTYYLELAIQEIRDAIDYNDIN